MALSFWGDCSVPNSKKLEYYGVRYFIMFRYGEYTKTKRELDIASPSGGGGGMGVGGG